MLWAIDYFNSRGSGLKIRPVISHNILPSAAVEELASQGISVILGGGSSQLVQEILPYCTSAQIPLISPSSSASDLAVPGDLLYRGQHDSYGPGKLAGQMAREEGLSGYLIFTGTDNDLYGRPFAHGFSEAADMMPLQRYKVGGSLSSTTISHILDEKRAFDTAVMILPDHWACLMAQQLKLFYPGLKIWIADWGTDPPVARLGGPTMEGIRQAGYFSVELQELDHPFIKLVNGHYGNDWDPFTLDMGFRAVSFLVAASSISEETGEGIRHSLEGVHQIEGLHGPLPVNDNGDVEAPLRLAHIEQGQWVEDSLRVQP